MSEENVITLNYQQSTIVVKAFDAVSQFGYAEKGLYLGAFKENENQVYIKIIDDLSGDYIDINITKGGLNNERN